MLKRVNVSDVELGMFIHKLEGSWFKHPFWKSRFLLQDIGMLRDLQASDVGGVIIDTDKGDDVRTLPQRPAGTPAVLARPLRQAANDRRKPPANRQSAPTDLRSTAPQTMAREFGLAKKVADNSRRVVSRMFLESRFGKTIRSSAVSPVIDDIFASIQRNPHAFNGLMRCKRDNEELYRHALAVSALMISLARQMKLPPHEIREAGMAGLLIDVGIGHLPVDLSKNGGDYLSLDPEILKQHVPLGYNFLESAGGFSRNVLSACLSHHERLDGSGYPSGLMGADIDRISRMAAICDAYDTLATGTRSDDGMNPAIVIQAMSSNPGWFDPGLMTAFTETMGSYPVGSIVKLRSQRLAMVVDQDPADHTRPKVRAFYSIAHKRMVSPEDIKLSDCYGEDEIAGIADPDAHGIADFPKLREKLFNGAARSG